MYIYVETQFKEWNIIVKKIFYKDQINCCKNLKAITWCCCKHIWRNNVSYMYNGEYCKSSLNR